jgi:hypothetical protein
LHKRVISSHIPYFKDILASYTQNQLINPNLTFSTYKILVVVCVSKERSAEKVPSQKEKKRNIDLLLWSTSSSSSYTRIWVHSPDPRQLIKSTCHVSRF